MLDGGVLPVDLAANAESLGADVLRTSTVDELKVALRKARSAERTTVVYIETDPLAPVPSSESWWDVPVSAVAAIESTREARASYEAAKSRQRPYL
jgi:3D-(3,5/4)-trihydroxycyclohexane-1,2-dione acylhydrolase (decyclizing)